MGEERRALPFSSDSHWLLWALDRTWKLLLAQVRCQSKWDNQVLQWCLSSWRKEMIGVEDQYFVWLWVCFFSFCVFLGVNHMFWTEYVSGLDRLDSLGLKQDCFCQFWSTFVWSGERSGWEPHWWTHSKLKAVALWLFYWLMVICFKMSENDEKCWSKSKMTSSNVSFCPQLKIVWF